MVNDDKYPDDSSRRRFVKGVVGSAALASVGTATGAMLNTTTNPSGAGGGTTEYFGVENVDGPAPRAMPQIPVRIDEEGYVMGLWPEVQEVTEGGQTFVSARTELPAPSGTILYSNNWFQYCGVQTYPGVQPEADQDQYFRYANSPPYEWQREEVSAGDRVNVDDFSDYETWGNDIGDGSLGKPAFATWRSEGIPPTSAMPVQIIRSTRIEEAAASGNPWVQASTQQGFLAILDKCTHFCCVPGFKSFVDSAKFDAANEIYCQCHQSVYDPFSLVRRSFVALPRPEE